MSEIAHLTYKLPPRLLELLITIVETANAEEALTVKCFYEVTSNRRGWRIGNSTSSRFVSGPDQGSLNSLQVAGYVLQMPSDDRKFKYYVFVHPVAYDRVLYEARWTITKWWVRVWRSGTPATALSLVVSLLAFLFSIFADLSSAIIEVLRMRDFLP